MARHVGPYELISGDCRAVLQQQHACCDCRHRVDEIEAEQELQLFDHVIGRAVVAEQFLRATHRGQVEVHPTYIVIRRGRNGTISRTATEVTGYTTARRHERDVHACRRRLG